MMLRIPTKLALSGASSLLALAALPHAAQAQSVDEAIDAAEADIDEPTGNAIIVTAQRRAENLQDVPAAVTAFSAVELERRQVFDANDLTSQVPGVVITTGTGTSSSARIFFRGVGEDESRGAVDPAVGIYIDNVYLGRTVGSLVDLVDVEQVEVLRGPQGTLYGRNTNGGAIKFTSVRPQLLENSVTAEIGTGNYDRIQARGTVNLALADTLAVRVSGLYREREGFFELNPNGDFASFAGTEVGDEEVYSVRGSLYGEMSDAWSVLAIFDYTKDNSDPIPSSLVDESDNPAIVTDRDQDIFTIEPAAGVTCSAATPVNFQAIGCITNYNSEVETYGASIQLTGDYDNFSVTSISALRALKDDLDSFISFPFFQETRQHQFSQEVLVNTNFDGPFNLTTGAFYYYEDVDLDYDFIFPFANDVETESFSVFGQGTFDITDALTLTGGLRWTTEDRDFVGNAGGPLAGFGSNIVGAADTDNITWTAKIDYSLTDDILFYASYATGFKSPGFSPDCFNPLACFRQVDEEELDSIEGGIRTQFWDGRVTFNATYFYNDYQDLQISGTLPSGAFTRINAGEARIQGVEIDGQIEAFDGFTIYGNASYLDGEYQTLNFDQAGLLTNSSVTNPGLACTGVSTAPGEPVIEQEIIDCALGLELKNAPEFKALVGFIAEVPIGNGDLFFGADAAWEDDTFGLVANVPGTEQEPGLRIDARVGYTTGRYRISIWGKNLTDREYFRANTFNAPTRQNQVFAAPPLTFGVDVGISFD
ncbi:TonB-dependent receptor [Erythrobacter sp.]|jgi:iron complex outermembrane receptor protein|uniref:TonB-dependent receptor n=1 Tax=Erythrobacter sp. TaxID=1042 RepID=UPI002EBFB42E|nr:TonB-dependent receptor [Erythrobacter sp.]